MIRPYYNRYILIALLLSGCGEQPTRVEPATTPEPIPVESELVLEEPEGPYTDILQHVERLLSEAQPLQAAYVLDQITPQDLTTRSESVHYAILRSHLQLIQDDTSAAIATFERLRPSAPLSKEWRWLEGQWHAHLMRIDGNYLQAAHRSDALLAERNDPAQRRILQEQIWLDLQRAPLADIELELNRTRNLDWRGWLALAQISGQVLENPTTQAVQIQHWQRQFPLHPCADALPGGLSLLGNLAQQTPRRVALLLPLSNSLAVAGKAVLDGYMAALYESNRRGWPEQQLSVLDTANYSNINDAYQAALDDGAELVIGPLSKRLLASWQPGISTPVPLFTLNRFPQPPMTAGDLYQFSLAPDDEARQLAEYAFAEGGRRALVIRSNGKWGDNINTALLDRWGQLSGEVLATAVYNNRDDYSESLATALALNKSEERARNLRAIIANNVEFTPRRRQDIDTVFLLSGRPNEARSIKPLIAFHYAADLPVYSTSHVYSGRRDPQQDKDLNNLRLLEIPWLLEQEEPLHDAVNSNAPMATLAAMYAMGADAFILHWRLPQLYSSVAAAVRGRTGLLSMDEQGRIRRQLNRARIVAGVPEAVTRR